MIDKCSHVRKERDEALEALSREKADHDAMVLALQAELEEVSRQRDALLHEAQKLRHQAATLCDWLCQAGRHTTALSVFDDWRKWRATYLCGDNPWRRLS